MDRQIEEKLGIDSTLGRKVLGFEKIETEAQAREFAIGMIGNANMFIPHLLDKVWILYKSKDQFIISDNPVALQNTVNKSTIRGTLGLAVRGIELYLPLSPQFALSLMCSETFAEVANTFDRVHQELDQQGKFETRNFVNSVRRKLPVDCLSENVENINSLQVLFSERFLFGRDGDFSIAKEMTKESVKLRHGPRTTMT